MIKAKIHSVIEHLRKNPRDESPNLRKSMGILLILTGVAGLFLPFIQGILFISIGFLILTRKDWKRIIVKRYDRFLKKRAKKKLIRKIHA